MRKNKLKLMSVVCVSYLMANHANAVPYIDANIGGNTTDSSMAYSADAGYMFNKYLGLEGGVTGSGSSNATQSNFYMFDGAAKGVLPLGSGIDIFGKLGVGDCNSCGSNANSNLGIFVGAGLEFNINKNWAIQLQDYTVTGDAPNFIMFGGEFKFY